MKLCGIYQIQSKIKPNKIYIGSSVDINYRWNRHINLLRRLAHNSSKLQNHYNKYGKYDLQFSILLCCNREDLIKTEQFFIDAYNPWFNTCKIAGNTLGIKPSEETKMKISIGGKGLKRSEETKQRMRKPKSEEHRIKIRLAQKGKIISEAQRIKQSIAMTGRKHSEARNEINRQSQLGKKMSEESKRKISEAAKKRHALYKKHKLSA